MQVERSRWVMCAGAIALATLALACRGASEPKPDPAHARRNVDELQRLVQQPRTCADDAECPTGSHCDPASDRCTWACLADSECGSGKRCDLHGACVAGAQALVANTAVGCQALPAADRRAALLDLFNNAQQGDFVTCDSDDTCPCGAHCSADAICQADCLELAPTPELTCGAGLACTPLGRCATAPSDPGPPLALTIALSDTVTRANTATVPVVVPLTVTVSAISLDVLSPSNPAVVKLSIAEVRAFEQGQTAVAPAVAPRVRCAPGDPLTSACVISGGWTFNVAAGQLRSAPRTIWVEVPQTTTPQTWTLEARSEWAADPATDVIQAAPVIIPATDPGRYKGRLFLANDGAVTSDRPLALPVEAIVTATHVALFEPTRVVLPDGHAVLARTGAKATLLGWLSSGASRYDVVLGAPTFVYTPTTGQLDGQIAVTDGTGAASTTLSLALERTGEALPPACPCAAGSYCNAAMAICLPGAGPPDGGGIVNAASATPSSVLPSATVAAWSPPLATIAAGAASLLGGTGIAGVERAYCFKDLGQLGGPARFGASPKLDPISGDLQCGAPGLEYVQPTFGFATTNREYTPGTGGGSAFDLFEACLTDLGRQPTGPASADNLLSASSCASLGRFLLAINANVVGGVGQPLPDIGQRLVDHVLRQWLGVHAYVAAAAIQVRQYDDALSISSAPAHTQLGNTIDVIDAGLRVLLDPRVRGQYTAGTGLPSVLLAPDYRIQPRPASRWTFNEHTSPAPDAEGSAPFTVSGASLAESDLHFVHGATGTYACGTSQAIGLADRRFTIAADLHYRPQNGTTTVLFDKQATNGNRLWLEATTIDAGVHLNLALKDSFGGIARFAPIGQGFIAITADGTDYRLFFAPLGLPATQTVATAVIGGGPRWGAAGTVKLACDIPVIPGACTSWDRNVHGDNLDVVFLAPYVEHGATWRYSCTEQLTSPFKTTCSGIEPAASVCTAQAATRRTQLIQGLFPNPPAAAVNAMTVTGAIVNVGSGLEPHPKFVVNWDDYRCDFTVKNRPVPVTSVKPVCTPVGIRWDEVSLWSRPVTFDELAAMAASYGEVKTQQSLPPKLPPPTSGKEQATGLPAHLLEAASADLALLADYIEAERAVMYEECYLGGPSLARDRVAARAGRNLRLVGLLEHEAQHLVELPGVAGAAWIPRYEAAARELAGRRTRAVEALALAGECKNPLGITEDDLPLYVGEEVGASGKFFASSRFLTSKAKEEIALAQGKLTSAQTRYVEQRQSAYQLDQARESKALREGKLRTDYESALLRYCGKPAGTRKLLDGFLAGALAPENCYLKTELPECSNLTGVALGDVPASCLRGEIGSRLLTIKAAAIDMANATNAHRRSMEQQAGDGAYCARRQAEFELDEAILHKHDVHMQRLRDQARRTQGWFSVVKSFMAFALAADGDPEASIAAFTSVLNLEAAFLSGSVEEEEEREQASYAEFVQARSHALDIADCFHKVDNEEFAIKASLDVIDRANQQVVTAAFELASAKNAVEGLIDEASGQLAIELGIDGTPPHLHYWLDADITEYHRHVEYARRLTYLALRAFEYEAQQTIGHRGETLTARRPDELLAVVTAIEQRNAPMQGELGLVIGARPVVLSLRDEILRILDVASGTRALPGEPLMTPEQAFKRFLASESSKILDGNGRLIGRGIRFALRPAAWTETSCAERIWRITPSLQIDNPPTQHGVVLYQDNAFGSQDCRAEFGTVRVSRAEPAANLLAGDTAVFTTPSSSTALNLDGPLGLDHETLRARPEGDISGFAGRGLYGNYILLFPPQTWPEAEISKVKDLLIRFDIVEVTHSSPL